MYYASIGIIALIVHLIINYEALRKVENTSENFVRLKYRHYLLALLLYYCTDAMWGLLYDAGFINATYIDTCLFFFAMALSVLFWTKTVVVFTGNKGRSGKILVGAGWLIFAFQLIVLVINIFVPVVFTFDADKEYIALPTRYVVLFMQMILFCAVAVSAIITALRSEGDQRSHYRTVGFSSIIMAVFIAMQMVFPLMPLYSLGCLFGTCLIHTFVYKDKDIEHNRQMEAVSQKAYKDGLTGVRNKLAYLETLADIETSIENGTLKQYGVVVFDLNGLKVINDNLGHEAGDEYIKSAANLICRQFAHSPVFRIGGDEFVVILRGADYENREELESAFRAVIDDNQQQGAVVISSGLAIYESGIDESYNDVFNRADELMYTRKMELKSRK